MKPLFVTALLACFYVPRRHSFRSGLGLLFASRLRKPKRFRLICFRRPPSGKGPTWLAHRICGLPGDLIEIRNGILFVNHIDADKDLNLYHVFKVNRSDSSAIRHDPRLAYTIPPYPDIVYLTLPGRTVRDQQLPCEQYVLPPGLRNENIFSIYKKNWNNDNFGPVKVPPGNWFVLGDDRAHSIDSRHLGFVEQRYILGAVL